MIMRLAKNEGSTLMATLDMQNTAQLAESRRKMRARRRMKNRIALTLNGDDGIWPVLADLDFDVHHHARY